MRKTGEPGNVLGWHTTAGNSIKTEAEIQDKPWIYSMFHRCVSFRLWSTPEIIIPNNTQSTMSLINKLHLYTSVPLKTQVCTSGDQWLRPWAIRSISHGHTQTFGKWEPLSWLGIKKLERLDNDNDNPWISYHRMLRSNRLSKRSQQLSRSCDPVPILQF